MRQTYDRALTLFPADVLAWVQATQPKAWETLTKNHGAKVGETLLARLRDRLGTLNVLRHGIEPAADKPMDGRRSQGWATIPGMGDDPRDGRRAHGWATSPWMGDEPMDGRGRPRREPAAEVGRVGNRRPTSPGMGDEPMDGRGRPRRERAAEVGRVGNRRPR